MLPLNPTSYGDSPYQSFSAFALNPYFIDLDVLVREGLLTKKEVKKCKGGSNPHFVDYGKIYNERFEGNSNSIRQYDQRKRRSYYYAGF